MNYKLFIFVLFVCHACAPVDKEIKYSSYVNYSNNGFTLIYNQKLYEEEIISKSINKRSLVIFNKYLKEGTSVRITNHLNNKYLVAHVGKSAKFPNFYNSVISKRIADELEINLSQPYIKLQTINLSSTTIANKAITYDEERNVADKAPVEGIFIKNISIENNTESSEDIAANIQPKFSFIIKIADLFFEDSALMLKKRLEDEFNIKNIQIKKMSQNTFRVYKGPFRELDSIKREFYNIDKLEFENIEIIRL